MSLPNEVVVSTSKLTAIGDAIRSRFGVSGELTLDEMAETIYPLPSGYQEVNYVQSNGGQYIDTGYTPILSTKWELTAMFISSNGDSCYNGRYGGGDGNRFIIGCQGLGSGQTPILLVAIGSPSSFGLGSPFVLNHKNKITINASDMSYKVENEDSVVFQGTVVASLTFNSDESLFLFSRQVSGTATEFSTQRIYRHKIWEGNTIVQDFIPCYRKSDNEIGLYDIINGQFYTNAGSGSFTCYPAPIN